MAINNLAIKNVFLSLFQQIQEFQQSPHGVNLVLKRINGALKPL